jgi:beta-lactamase regulating signal transducer with metallopeptidase domain
MSGDANLAIFDLLARSTLLITLVWLAACAVARVGGSAAMRHIVWLLGLFTLILIPIAMATLPPLPVPILPVEGSLPTVPGDPLGSRPSLAGSGSANLRGLAEGLYLVVAAMLLIRLLVGRSLLCLQWRKAQDPADTGWAALLDDLKQGLGIQRAVRLRLASGPAMPMTWGVLAPRILLPSDARGWSMERRRIVLLHELAHVVRLDSLSRMAAAAVCALYWFHPLVWHASRKMRLEQEHAADDLVLTAGAAPRLYARTLLETAGTLHSPRLIGTCSVAMARASELERRLLAIVGGASRRSAGVLFTSGSGTIALLLTLLVAAAVPVSAVHRSLPGPLQHPVPALANTNRSALANTNRSPLALTAAVKPEPRLPVDAGSLQGRALLEGTKIERARNRGSGPDTAAVGATSQDDRVIVRGGIVIRRSSTPDELRADAIQLTAEARQEAAEEARERGEGQADALADRSPPAGAHCPDPSRVVISDAEVDGSGPAGRRRIVICH